MPAQALLRDPVAGWSLRARGIDTYSAIHLFDRIDGGRNRDPLQIALSTISFNSTEIDCWRFVPNTSRSKPGRATCGRISSSSLLRIPCGGPRARCGGFAARQSRGGCHLQNSFVPHGVRRLDPRGGVRRGLRFRERHPLGGGLGPVHRVWVRPVGAPLHACDRGPVVHARTAVEIPEAPEKSWSIVAVALGSNLAAAGACSTVSGATGKSTSRAAGDQPQPVVAPH